MKLNKLHQLIDETLTKPQVDGCGCGCGGCNEAPILTESKVKPLLSEGLQYHIDKKVPLHETIYRYGSEKHLMLVKEARRMYSRGVVELSEDDKQLVSTNLGEFALYEGVEVPLDLPMVNEESQMPTQDQVTKFFTKTQQELHYLYDKPVEDWDEYDLSNWKAKLRKYKEGRPQISEGKKKEKKDPPIGKPKRGGSKAYYVYVRDPKTKKVKKVSFGSGGLRAKIKDSKARSAFAKRHRCSEKNDRTKPSYWSCRLPRYAQALGLGSNSNTFW